VNSTAWNDTAPFWFELLTEQHDHTGFRCGEEALDRYFQTQVTQEIRRRVANCFVVVETATQRVAAYYTLSAASIPLTELPPDEAKLLPRYPAVPAVRIGRLAVDERFQRRGLVKPRVCGPTRTETNHKDAPPFTKHAVNKPPAPLADVDTVMVAGVPEKCGIGGRRIFSQITDAIQGLVVVRLSLDL
jgi:hypothetical protein